MSFFNLMLQNNVFTNCVVSSSPSYGGGNAYGGGVSVYIGGYSSVYSQNGAAVAAVGDTVVRNVTLTLDKAQFTSCIAMCPESSNIGSNSANTYGGSLSFYIGAYAWSYSTSTNSSSTCGATNASGVSVSVSNAPSSNCSAATTTTGGLSSGANAYGGSMSVVYVGAYAWSYSASTSASSSTCGATNASGVSVSVSNAPSSNCSAATTTTGGLSFGANAYGGSMNLVFIGGYSLSNSFGALNCVTLSSCDTTRVSGLFLSINSSTFSSAFAFSRKFVFNFERLSVVQMP